jgi:[ribosomal protein S5]-alanine N-acetyltransferase
MTRINLSPPCFTTPRLIVRMGSHRDVATIVRYFAENREFHQPFDPIRPAEFLTERFWQIQMENHAVEFECDRALRLFLFRRTQPETLVGNLNLTQFVRHPAHSCLLGYSLAEFHQGQGYMQEALTPVIAYMFTALGFHRIAAAYMPRNQRSGNLLRRLGFGVEGYARDYLMINGKWEDHILTSLLCAAYGDDAAG